MKLLVDNQLPLALARFLASEGFQSLHVQDIGLDTAEDRIIWEYAKTQGFAIITKDEDFPILADRHNDISPQVIWVRLGNCRKAALLEAFKKVLPDMRHLLDSGAQVIELR